MKKKLIFVRIPAPGHMTNFFIFENNFSIKIIIAKVDWALAKGQMIMKLIQKPVSIFILAYTYIQNIHNVFIYITYRYIKLHDIYIYIYVYIYDIY